jgi:hypothetical protein|tara:strand:+ start:368 stop:676 length:309 start_codon:yes stop_codon:yes gene_type:complete
MAHKVLDFNLDGTYVERDATSEEQQFLQEKKDNKFNDLMSSLRNTRNVLLAQTDWIVTKAKETGGTIPSAWKTYRQELRDLTNGLTTVDEVNAVEFPERPST